MMAMLVGGVMMMILVVMMMCEVVILYLRVCQLLALLFLFSCYHLFKEDNDQTVLFLSKHKGDNLTMWDSNIGRSVFDKREAKTYNRYDI